MPQLEPPTQPPLEPRAEPRREEMQSDLLDIARLGAMTEISAILAHELNQPLAAIMNYVKAAQRTLERTDDPQAVKARDMVIKAGEQTTRASQLIRQLRDFVDKRKADLHEEKLHALIEDAASTALSSASDAGVAVSLALDSTLTVHVDKIRIQQAMINLIRNAIEAMQAVPDRRLHIESVRGESGVAQVTISDTGPGLAEEVEARLFQPFNTTKEKGMGIGLTISRSIINAHGGRLWATRNEQAGMSFHFQLPLAEKAGA